MGASASSEMEPDGGDMDDAWMDRAWKDGVPFTLLHDDAFVAEKYQELRQNRPETFGRSSSDDDGDTLEMTGTDELPMDELERMADAARVKLFAVPREGKSANEVAEGGAGERSDSSRHKTRRRSTANALTAMEGTALARESRERVTSERRRTQQCAIVRDYMALLARRLEKRAKSAQERERQSKESEEGSKNVTTAAPGDGTASRVISGQRTVSAPGHSLFQVSSFRMQLEMLRAFRSVSPILFENSLLALVQTVLEFRPFALHHSRDEKDLAAVNELLIEDVERFSRDMLAIPELSEGHRGLALVLLLGLGVASGRSGLLVEFVAQVFRPKQEGSSDANGNLLSIPIGGRAFYEWVEDLLVQLESYRVNYKLGTLTEESLVKQVNFKMIRDDASTTNGPVKDSAKHSTSVATDGSYVYTWSITDGLTKIGTGQNFTVGGRVYARAPSKQFLRVLREPRAFHSGFYGSGHDATALVQAFVETGSMSDEPLKSVREFVGVGEEVKSGRLYVRLIQDGKATGRVFEDSEEFRLLSSSEDPSSAVQVQFAFYGSFIVVSDDALERLRAVSSESDQDALSGVALDSELLFELLATSGAQEAEISDESGLILLYSATTSTSDLVLEKFAMGEVISRFEEPGDDVYYSSMVLVEDQIFLSLLHPTSSEPTSSLIETPRHRPRRLLRISNADLSLLGELCVSASDSDDHCGALNILRVTRPLFSYVSEGRRLYEIELSADRFRVRAFSVTKNSNNATFLRSIDVDVKQIQCATFVSCALKILKTELRVGDLDFALPSFYTNGSYIGMMLPSITAVVPAHEVHFAARAKFDILMIDCETGAILSDDQVSEFASSTSSANGPRDTKSFERTLPGGSCCFDATNNTIWIVNASRATMCAYRNPGRCIPKGDDEGELLVKRLRGDGLREGHPTPEAIGLQVLSFLAKHADNGFGESSDDASGKPTHPQPYAVDKSVASLSNLLGLAEALAEKRLRHLATESELESLRSCLCVLQSGMLGRDESRFQAPNDPGSFEALQPRLESLLRKIIHDNYSAEASSPDLNVRVVSAALALSASTAHLVDANIKAQVERVVLLVQKWRKGALSQSETVIAISLLRQLRKSFEAANIDSSSASENVDVVESFTALWNELITLQEDRLKNVVAQADQGPSQDVSDDLSRELVGTVNCFVQATFSRCIRSPNSFRLALQIFVTGCRGFDKIVALAVSALKQTQCIKPIQSRIERHLRHGVIRQVVPAMFASATTLLRQWDDIAQSFIDEEDAADKGSRRAPPSRLEMRRELGLSLSSQADAVEALFKSLHELAASLQTDEKVVSVASVTRSTRSEVIETSHEYENNLDVTTELRIPGATQMTISFDPRSRTEFNYDYVTFFKDKSQTAFYGEQYYSGRDAEFNWPGVNGLPPLVIDSDHCFVHFHSDASNTDWGYKFTAVGEIYEKATVIQRHWLSALTEMALNVLDETGKLLVEGTQLVPISEMEARNDDILHSDLLRHGVGAESEQNAGVLYLLRDFVAPPEGSDAARVLRAMEEESGHARLRSRTSTFGAETGATSRNPINTAIRAATAAILHHNMWGMDAYALAQNLRSDVSEQLLRGWKNAQKMRDWFHLGDAAAEAASNASESSNRRSSRQLLLKRQPSAYKGMSDEALQQLSKNVVERAVFLLEMTPMSFSYVSGAKRRWNFLARYGSALDVGKSLSRSSSDSTLGKWYNLLDELQEATELRSLLTYRRSSSERRKSRQLKSVTEQVLEFIQSDIDVSELRELVQIRNERARYRTRGFQLYARSFQASFGSVRLRSTLIDSCSASLRQVALLAVHSVAKVTLPATTTVDALPTPRLHFGTMLSGCDGPLRKEVNGAFGVCLSQLSRDLASLIGDDNAAVSTEYTVSMIKAICIDYDIDDMYLLQESNILPLLLRLLASEASRVRRSAQVLLDVLLSRLVEAGASGDQDGSEASLFQKQLFATVGLQLEGITSLVRDLAAASSQGGNYGSMWRYREQNLARPCSSLTLPVSKDCDLKWNHSIMLWMYVSSSVSSYALKVGDEVQRGPSWSDMSESVGGTAHSGVVTAITSPTTVRVKWTSSTEESEHAFDPKTGKLDVILARESVGGVVFCKGTRNLAKDSALAAPWSHFGLFLNDRRQLSYKISCGAGKECVYETNYELDANDWAHVAIIQNEDVLKFYVNGLLVTQHVLDPFLILRESYSASESKITESPHPITESSDQYWPIHFPGASKIRVTFDPLSEIEQSSGFVRFYKNARCNEVWGEDKYTGRYHDPERNFPGALSNRHRSRRSVAAAAASQGSLEIPSDRFLVYFSHSGSEAKTWGFRLLATPEFASSSSGGGQLAQPSLNAHPFYIGEPPGRILDAPAAKCWLYQPETLNVALAEDEIVEAMQSSCPSASPQELPVDRALHVIGLLHTCSETPLGRELIATPENVGDLITIAFEELAPVEVRCASVVVLQQLCSTVSAEFFDEQLHRVKLMEVEQGHGFAEFVFSALVRAVNVWANYAENRLPQQKLEESTDTFEDSESIPPCPMEFQVSATESSALAAAYASLVRRLAANEAFAGPICHVIERSLGQWQELRHEKEWTSVAGQIIAVLYLLGGTYTSVSVGGRVKCCANIDGKETIETGYLLRYQQSSGQRTARVLFDCEPAHPVDVPVSDVAYAKHEDEAEVAEFVQVVTTKLPLHSIEQLYHPLLTKLEVDIPVENVSFKPKVSRKENVEVLESEHPYVAGEDVAYTLRFRGADEIIIYFDPLSSTGGQSDYVSFLKRTDDNRQMSCPESNNGKPYWGEERYYGESFPGVRGAPPLRIPASSVDVHFHTDSTSMGSGVPTSEWGFRLTAHAYEETLTHAPEVPPTFFTNAMNDIRARAIKSLHTCVEAFSSEFMTDSDESLQPLVSLMPHLASIANAPDDGRPTQCSARTQIFESKHPYANSVKECMAITFSGAARLVITFDPQSRTEQTSDYVCFFKDKSLTDRWGEYQYSGIDENGNWPGILDRPPLVIPSDSFTLLWTTDASNVEWGWRFTVSAEYPIITPLALRLDQLDKQAQDMWEIFYEGIGPQRTPFDEEYDGFEKISSAAELHELQTQNDPTRSLLFSTRRDDETRRVSPVGKKFRVLDGDGVDVHQSPSVSATVLGRLKHGDELKVVQEKKAWLKMRWGDGAGVQDVFGWVKRRSEDKLHVASVETSVLNEDVLILGIDDQNIDQRHSENSSLVLDDNNAEDEVLVKFVSQYSYEALKGQSVRYQSLAYDTHRALAIKYARATLVMILCSGRNSAPAAMPTTPAIPLQVRDFGSPNEMILFLSRVVSDREHSIQDAELDEIVKRLVLGSAARRDMSIRELMTRCVEVLETSGDLLPRGRGAMRMLESRHPYLDDVDQYWQLAVPGAKKILVYFDARSKSETGCDWVCFYKNGSDRREYFGEIQYSGRNGTENWPGCGGRPPLVIEADSFEVHFHSDANQNDWGFKLFAVGVFDEDDAETSPVLDDKKLDALVQLMRLCLRVLLVAAKLCISSSSLPSPDVSALRSSVFSARIVQALVVSLNHHPQQVRPLSLQLLQTLMQDTQFTHSVPSSLVEELRSILATKIRAQFVVEERAEAKSEYLQMLVECALFVDLAIDSACFLPQYHRERDDRTTLLTFSSSAAAASKSEQAMCEWSTERDIDEHEKSLHIQFQLRSVSAAFEIDLSVKRDGGERDSLLRWSSDGKITASPLLGSKGSIPDARLQSGDVISIHVDLQYLVVVLRKNALCVHSSASGEKGRDELEKTRMVTIRVTTSSASDQVAMRHLSYSPLVSLPQVISPNWYNKVCEAMGMLLDFKERRIASVVECESEHPLPVSKKASVSHEPERVCVDDAVALEIRFDRRTALHKRHRLRFSVPEGQSEFKSELSGICGANCDEEYPALFLADPLKRTGILKPGDRVIRSSDWCYADEDGGRGCVGVVEEIVSWNGRSGCGVRVRWQSSTGDEDDNASTATYRYGYDGCFDVQLVHQPHLWDAPLVIPGNTLQFALNCVEDDVSPGKQSLHIGDDQDFQGTLRLDRTSASALQLDVRKTKLMLGDDSTIECWFCLSALTTESQILLEIATLDPSHSLFLCVATEGRVFVQAQTADDLASASASDVPRSAPALGVTVVEHQWFHLGVVFSSSKLHVYVNGECVQLVSIDQKLIHRSLYVDSITVGGRLGIHSMPPALVAARGHVCDVQIWDVALHSEQIRSHAQGIDGVSPRDTIGWQSPAPSMPQAPRKLSRQSQLSQLLPPPSPPRSPRSPSRGMNVPPHQKKWIMVNRMGRELATVRANCAIDRDCLPTTTSQPLVVYFEAHVLSTGRLSVGWFDVDSLPSSREQLLGEFGGSIGIELPRRRVLFDGDAIELEHPSMGFEGLRSPRRRSSSGSSAGAGFADVFSREGDVIGCSFAPATNDFSFYLNGDLLLEMRLGGIEAPVEEQATVAEEEVQETFESLVDEMLALGFSREASEDALEASSASSTPIRTVQRAIDWLIDESTGSQRDSPALSSPRRLSASSPLASPRRRLSSNSIAMTQLRRVVSAEGASRRQTCFVPAATLGAQGAQGIAWNLGQRPFKYTPGSKGVVLSAMQAANCADKDGERIHFEVFDHSDKKWERVTYRHRLQDLVPTLLARWRLDEGSGTTVYDSSGRDQVGTIQLPDQTTGSSVSSAPLSPRSRRPVASGSWWDSTCLPPVAVTRGSDSVLFSESGASEPATAAAETTVWGYRFYVIPHFSEASIGRRRFQTQAHRFIMDGPTMELRHDQQLVKYVNKVAVAKQLHVSQVLRASWSELAPPDSELVKWPVLVEIATGVLQSTGSDDSTAAVTKAVAGSAKAAAMDRLNKRFKLLQELNSAVSRLLPFTAFAPKVLEGVTMRLETLIREQRQRVLHAVKRGIWDEALKRTTEKGHTVELIVNRPKAMRHRVSGKVDVEGRFALFSQAFRQLNGLSGGHFRRSTAVYHVQFLGENAQDAGGPYRETLAQLADELHSSQLPLLIASSNAQHNVGAAREKWVLNPSATSATQLQMLEFLGKLMGAAMRSQEYLSLQIALLIWKQLASESVTVSDDLTLVDSMIVSSMQKIRTIDQFGVSAEMFEDIVMETFTTLSTDNRLVPLKPHGASIAVTFENRIEFADLVEAYRLHEFDTQTAALLRGLAKVVPARLLSLFTGAELEQMVCGSPEVDVDLLQRCTEYSSCDPADEHIVWFWQVLRDFSHDERSVFLRFVWGRSRLPPNEKEFPQRFKLQSFNKPVRPSSSTADSTAAASTALDGYLPIAHTCFFSVELPRYSSQEVLREKLVYAMYNCQEIDGDGDSVAANQLGWEE